MRTTVTLEPDVAEQVKAFAHARRTSFKQALDELLRRGLSSQAAASGGRPFVVEPVSLGFRPGVDPGRLNQLVDELEAEAFVGKPAR